MHHFMYRAAGNGSNKIVNCLIVSPWLPGNESPTNKHAYAIIEKMQTRN